MNFDQISNILNKEPAYRQNQVKRLLFKDLISDWSEATTLPLVLRQRLNQCCQLLIKAKAFVSKDKNTVKAVIGLEDGLNIESVLMKHKDGRNTVCVSSQIGCPLGCHFCLTGKMGFKRNLQSWEIVEQVLFFSRYLKPKKQKVTNIVFMGMGEPFLNYDNVFEAIRILQDDNGFNLGARHFSISTVGIIDGIKKMAQEKLEVNLAISLHAPLDSLRSNIMPVNKKYSISEVLKAVDYYIEKTNRKVMFEYLMIHDVNDSPECALQLSRLMKKPLYFVNLISYNPTGEFQPSLPQKIKEFRNILEKKGVKVTQRHRFGHDIKAACGQLGGSKK